MMCLTCEKGHRGDGNFCSPECEQWDKENNAKSSYRTARLDIGGGYDRFDGRILGGVGAASPATTSSGEEYADAERIK